MEKFKTLKYPKLEVFVEGVGSVHFSNYEYETDDDRVIAALKKNPKVVHVGKSEAATPTKEQTEEPAP